MSGLDERVTDQSDNTLVAQAGDILRAAVSGRQGLSVLLSLALVIIAGVIAPGDSPGGWAWLRVIVIALLAAIAISSIAGFRNRSGDGQAPSLLIVWGGLLIAVIISLSFSALTAALAVIILVLLLFNASGGRSPHGLVFWSLVSALTPLWVWSAFEAWDRWLLMLVPIGAIGMVSLEHALRTDLSPPTHQIERLAAWIGVTLIGAGLLLTALLAGIDLSWVIAGAVAMALLAGLDLVLPGPTRERLPSFTVPGIALLALTFSWLIAL